MSAPASAGKRRSPRAAGTSPAADALGPARDAAQGRGGETTAESPLVHVASAPFAMQTYAASIVSAAECRLRQTLFGFEAQLGAYDHALREDGSELFFIPAPELFSASQSYRHMAELAGALRGSDAAPRLRHLRFGMARHARLLKHAENCFVLAESHALLPVTPTPHPFATGTVLPAGFHRLALYDSRQVGAGSITGRPIASDLLPPNYAAQDLQDALRHAVASGRPPAFGAARDDNEGALLVRSLGEFDAEAWSQGTTAGGPGAGSLDWRQALTLNRLASTRVGQPSAFLMIPWNMAHPASVIPDLVTKLCRAGNLTRASYRPVLFPYNEDADSAGAIAALSRAVSDSVQGDAASLRCVFIARLRTLAGAWALPRLFSLAWLEAGDPERLYNLARLKALGVPCCLVAAPAPGRALHSGVQGSPESETLAGDLAFVAFADESMSVSVSDQFGERLYIVPSMSPRALGTLVNRSIAHFGAHFGAARDGHGASGPGRFVVRHIVSPHVRFPAAGPREVGLRDVQEQGAA